MSTYNNTQWRAANEEKYREIKHECDKNWSENHKDYNKKRNAEWNKARRLEGSTKYCRLGFDKIENYDLAKADNFDTKLWHLHHRDENLHGTKWLKSNKQYFNLTPDKLIWLPYDEHKADAALSVTHPERSKWHKRSLELCN